MRRGNRDEGTTATETWREHLVWKTTQRHSRTGKTPTARKPAPPSSYSTPHTHQRLSHHSLRQRLQTLLQALRALFKEILTKTRAKTPKAAPILRTGQLVATLPREPRTTSALRRTFQSQAHPQHAATPSTPLEKPLPATPAPSNNVPNAPPTVAGPSDTEKHERMWARWKAEVDKGSDEYDGMALPHSGKWFRRFRDGKENWTPVRGGRVVEV